MKFVAASLLATLSVASAQMGYPPQIGMPGMMPGMMPGYGAPGMMPGMPGMMPGMMPGYGAPGMMPGTMPAYGMIDPGYGVPPPGYGMPGYGMPGYGMPGYGPTPGYGPPRPFMSMGPIPHQEPYLPDDSEFACGFYTWTTIPFKPQTIPPLSDGSHTYLDADNVYQAHSLFATNNYECLCDAFGNAITNVCRQRLNSQTPYVEEGLPPVSGPLPNNVMAFPPPRRDPMTGFNCQVYVDIYVPFTSPLPWEKHYDVSYEYERYDTMDCLCSLQGAPIMDTCAQSIISA